jgi:hypothetical protein
MKSSGKGKEEGEEVKEGDVLMSIEAGAGIRTSTLGTRI